MKIKTTETISCYVFLLIWLYISSLLWVYLTARVLTLGVTVCIFSILITSLLIGDIFLKYALNDSEQFNNFSTRLLIGMLLTNVFLCFIIFFSPYGLIFDWLVFVLLVFVIWKRTFSGETISRIGKSNAPECFFWVVATIAVSIWCRDILRPVEFRDGVAIIRVWQDVYYHLCQIGSLAKSKGFGSISDLQMLGAPVHVYHLASYALPALLVNATNISALTSYESFLVPFGILMTGVAAYSLASSVFGKWPAVAAGLGVLILPDAFQQGFGNKFLGNYYWLQQVGPGGNYGVASAAVSFIFLLEACRTTTYKNVFWGYLFVFITLMYKAQIFVAISFLAFIYPVLFMGQLSSKHRIYLFFLFTGIFIGILEFSQLLPGVPLIQPDGSGLTTYSSLIISRQTKGLIEELFVSALNFSGNNWALKACVSSLFITICTFGFFPLLYLLIVKHLKRNYDKSVWLFPVLVVSIYLSMAICLALDNRHVGTQEELLHRPFVWAYFVVVIWCSGGCCKIIFDDFSKRAVYKKYFITVISILLLYVPIYFSKDIQTYKEWGVGHQEIPLCQFEVAEFIKSNSGYSDVIQDSLNDPHFLLSGLSERRSFAIDSGGARTPTGIDTRLALLMDLKKFIESSKVESFMKQFTIKWYVTNPKDNVQWQEAMASRLSFQCGSYRVYQF